MTEEIVKSGGSCKEEDAAQPSKSVSEQIFDKFNEYIAGDALFSGISKDLSSEIRKEKRKKADIITALKKIGLEQK